MTNTAKVIKFTPADQKFKDQSTSQTHIELLREDESTGSSGLGIKNVFQFQKLIKSLNEVFAEAKIPNWDGENSESISDATYFNATKLLSVLPMILPSPEILPDNDGYIEFEWHNKGRSFSLYVTDSNLVLYAAYYGKGERLSGRFIYEGVFPGLAEHLAKNVYKEVTQR